ncbi:sensor histidine kinase [Dactylosporangium matsuzakiense]|nr:HAMP domain-containing sensor histidine kinase [Dactylosporangium matsuzakiense]UWZ44830.1 HAMP domain-containing histidine kinase [Dactylosporangium matsuzakiense]
MKSWPLRVKLVILMLVLLAAALVTTGIAGVVSTRDYLIDRVDAQLLDSVSQETPRCDTDGGKGGPGGGPVQRVGYYVGCINPDGSFRELYFNPNPSEPDQSRPVLPESGYTIVGHTTQLSANTGGAYATLDPVDGGHSWRVLYAQQAPSRDPFTHRIEDHDPVVVAISLDEVDNTVSRQIVMSATIGGFVLLVLAVVAYLLVRSSLRPLVEVEQTAEAIAAGDLSRRVPEADPRTEVGGLAKALNTMLGQIETAFEERRASEQAALASEQSALASEGRMRRFVADASHELRTPLTSIRGFAELHRQSGHNDDNMRRIEHHATRMGLLVDDLLLLARMDQQRPLEKKPVDLLALATDALIDARVTAADHRLRLRTPNSEDADADTEAPIVEGDEARLRQVLQNLLSNALNHTPPGTEVTVFVGTEGDKAILEVADNGPGMTDDDAARVFERFYRTDPSRTRALGGSGLGLSIVSALVKAHNGEVTLKTAPGEGATFRVTIPLHQ